MRGELPPAPSRVPLSRATTVRSRWLAIASNPDLHLVIAFCAIGYLTAINLILRFPEFGQIVSSLAIFP
jgi:hypothetical protein